MHHPDWDSTSGVATVDGLAEEGQPTGLGLGCCPIEKDLGIIHAPHPILCLDASLDVGVPVSKIQSILKVVVSWVCLQ